MQFSRKVRLQLQLQKYVFVLLVLCVAGLLAWLSKTHSMQFDWTANNRQSLSVGSVKLLNSLKGPVKVNVYTQDNKIVHALYEDILSPFQRRKIDFSYELINPDVDLIRTKQDDVTRYGQAVIKYQDRSEILDTLSEQSLSGSLLRLSRPANRNLVFLTGHGERDPDNNNNFNYQKLNKELTEKGFTDVSLNLLRAAIPANTTVLVIAAPSHEIPPGESAQIIDYINSGGNLLWMMDPGGMQGLDKLAEMLGIRFMNGVVVDDNAKLRNTLQIQHPAMLPVLDYKPHAITRDLEYNTLFPISRGIEQVNHDNWQAAVIAQSLPQSWAETAQLGGEIAFEPENGDVKGPVTIVIALERALKADTDEPEKASQRIVVTGDSDFLADSYIGAGANLQLGLNIINWLSGDDDLIAVDPKQAPDTKLQLDDTEILLISAGFLLVLPSALFVTGLVIWFRRRKR